MPKEKRKFSKGLIMLSLFFTLLLHGCGSNQVNEHSESLDTPSVKVEKSKRTQEEKSILSIDGKYRLTIKESIKKLPWSFEDAECALIEFNVSPTDSNNVLGLQNVFQSTQSGHQHYLSVFIYNNESYFGSYLSNELHYRVAYIRRTVRPDLPNGHIHVGFLSSDHFQDRDNFIADLKHILEKFLGTL